MEHVFQYDVIFINEQGQPGRYLSPELADITLYVIDVAAGEKTHARAGLGSRDRIS